MELNSTTDIRIKIYNGKSRPWSAGGNSCREIDKILDSLHDVSWELNAKVIAHTPYAHRHHGTQFD